MKLNIICLLLVLTLACHNTLCSMKRTKKNKEDAFFTSYSILSPYLYSHENKELLKSKITEFNKFCDKHLAQIKKEAYDIYQKLNTEKLQDYLNDLIVGNVQKSQSVKEVIENANLRQTIIEYGRFLKDIKTLSSNYSSSTSCNSSYNFLSFLAFRVKEKKDLNFLKNSLTDSSKEKQFFTTQQKQTEINIENINLLKTKLDNPQINYVGIYLSSYDESNTSNPHYIFLKRKDKNSFYLFQSFIDLYDVDTSIKAKKSLNINEICTSLMRINQNQSRKHSLTKLISYGGDVEQINNYFRGPIYVYPILNKLEERKEIVKSPTFFDKGNGISHDFNIIKYCSEHDDCSPEQTV